MQRVLLVLLCFAVKSPADEAKPVPFDVHLADGTNVSGMVEGINDDWSISVAGVKIQYLQALIPLIGILLAVGLQLYFQKSRDGKALLAVVQNKDAARLMGIRVERVIVISFALVIFALALRPNGLFGRSELRKV